MKLGSLAGPSGRDGVRLVHAAIDAGVTLFDTADAYAHGESERTLGRAVADRRDGVEIATKGGYCFDERSRLDVLARRVAAPALRRRRRPGGVTPSVHTPRYAAQDFSPRHLTAALEASLRRLRTDYVDTYQLHGPGRAHPELIPFLVDLVDRGLVRRIGIGAERLDVASEWIATASTGGGRVVDVVQVPFGPLDPGAAVALLPTAGSVGIDIWARGVFGGGVMSAAEAGARHLSARDQSRVVELRSVAARLGLDLYELAVAFVRSHRDVSTILLGMSSVSHLRHNVELVRSVDVLPDDVIEQIHGLEDAPGRRERHE